MLAAAVVAAVVVVADYYRQHSLSMKKQAMMRTDIKRKNIWIEFSLMFCLFQNHYKDNNTCFVVKSKITSFLGNTSVVCGEELWKKDVVA